MTYVTVSILQALPMHNLNRDQNGLPKSQYDGGVQRARLSSQSLKRAARILFREAISTPDESDKSDENKAGKSSKSVRTKESATRVTDLAEKWAGTKGQAFDRTDTLQRAKKVIDSLAAGQDKDSDNILFFAEAELETLARALVDRPTALNLHELGNPLDFRSPALDVAAFGRMFAARADLSTQSAVAVSHAVTTHQAKFTIDYFTAVDELKSDRTDSGAAHLGLAYYTSGVYYRTFTIDSGQLRRSWSGIDEDSARTQLKALTVALIKALPTGRLSNTNAHTTPFLVYVEKQLTRVSYEFETPVRPGADGGYKENSVRALADQVQLAQTFDPDNANAISSAVLGETYGVSLPGDPLESIDKVADFVADLILSAK